MTRLSITALTLLLLLGYYPLTTTAESASANPLYQAWQQQRSNLQIKGQGTVIKVLADDTKGSRHQRFIVKVSERQTLLIAHNIDLAPRLPDLKRGAHVVFFGEYEWNAKGGVVHWTHRDPNNRHPHGWLRYRGVRYW
jgi:hypothetical protein